MITHDDVLDYWFSTEGGDLDVLYARWFRGGPAVDREIIERFGEVAERARRGELDAWAETPRGLLALIIVIDQFSRHIHRGAGQAFAADHRALALATRAIDANMHADFSTPERLFLGLPLEHTEDLDVQRRAVAYFERMVLDAPEEFEPLARMTFDFARKHLDVIARFGRFPQRNAALGRVTTAEEQRYLDYLTKVDARF